MGNLAVFTASYPYMITPLIVAIVFWKASTKGRRVLLLRGIVALFVSVILARVGGAVYNEPRPFVVQHIAPLIPHPADNGFPSDHTLLSFACAFLVLPFSPAAAAFAALIATAVGIARIACHLHSATDIVASFAFALVANGVAWAAIRPKRDSAAMPGSEHSGVSQDSHG